MAIKSMTAYGAADLTVGQTTYRCEIKSLNSRFIEISTRLPRFLMSFDVEIQNLVKEKLKRGKVDIYFDIETLNANEKLPQLNIEAARHFMRLQETLLEDKDFSGLATNNRTLGIMDLLKFEGVLASEGSSERTPSTERYRDPLFQVLNDALKALIKSRETEGSALKLAMTELINSMAQDRTAVAERIDMLRADTYRNYKKRLENLIVKMQEAGLDVAKSLPEDRLMAEITILLDKADIAEEITRLASHEKEFLSAMQLGDDVGRRLDFLCQEMHREVNTMSSKQQNLEISTFTLNLKQSVERLRQQVQNIE